MKPLIAFLFLPLGALAALASCGPSNGPGNGAGGTDPTLATCQSAPLCDPLLLPTTCKVGGGVLVCDHGGGDAGTDGGSGGSGGGGGGGGGGGAGAGGGSGELSPLGRQHVQCILTALRDRKVGGVTIVQRDPGTDYCGTRVEIVSFGDGTASVLGVDYCAGDGTPGNAARVKLKPVDFFDACLAASDDAKLLDCVTSMTGDTATGGTCGCRGIHDDKNRGACHTQ